MLLLLLSPVRTASAETRFLISCGNTIGFLIAGPGTYVLRRAVSNCASDTAAIRVESSDVILDLNGLMVDGDDGASTIGIQVDSGFTDIAIRNGVVRDFANGVVVSNGNIRINGLTLTSAAGSGILGGDANRISGNSITDNGSDGVSAGDDVTIKRNQVFGNGGDGIELGYRALVANNTASGNGDNGIIVEDDGVVTENVTNGNANAGLYSNLDGILSNNVTQGNGDSGISTQGGGKVLGNIVTGNSCGGITSDTPVVIKFNKANGNTCDGIHVLNSAQVTVASNVANDNGEYGISAGPLVRGSGTNRAKDNGFASQCSPVEFCKTG